MNRILALQGIQGSSLGLDGLIANSDQSNNCSSETTACSTRSFGCAPQQQLIPW